MRRQRGTGRIYVKSGAYYGRSRTLDGRYVNRKLGEVRTRANTVGISRTEANRLPRGLVEAESKRTPTVVDSRPRTVDEVAAELRDRFILEGARLSYRQNCESMQRVHITPVLGKRRLDSVKSQDVERLARTMLAKGLAPKTVRNVMTFLYAVFALAVEKESGDIAGLALLVARAGHDATSPHANRGKGLAGG